MAAGAGADDRGRDHHVPDPGEPVSGAAALARARREALAEAAEEILLAPYDANIDEDAPVWAFRWLQARSLRG